MYFSRKIDSALQEWKSDGGHKPLLVRGARQTGKTTAIRHLGESFPNMLEVNLEADASSNAFFQGDIDVRSILSHLEMRYGRPITPGKTLLFLDEIQACPRAIAALRYFYEQLPELHVVASGSLLEFAFADMKDFGVGRIRNAFVHPFSFQEFAAAMGESILLDGARESTFQRPLADVLHQRLLGLLREFIIVGGMPAAVRAYSRRRSFLDARREQDDILVSLKADFGKYAGRIPPKRISQTLSSVLHQTGEKYVYTDGEQGLSYRQAKECTFLLEQARLIRRVECTRANGIPLGGDINQKQNKFLFLDTGLLLRESGLELSHSMADSFVEFVNRGPLAEMLAGLELLKSASPFEDAQLHYWRREVRGACAEVDYVRQVGGRIIPIEVKCGVRGSMKSLRLMMEEKNLPLAVRTSQENLGTLPDVRIVPLYLVGELERFL